MPDAPHPVSDRRRWEILALLGVAQLMVVLDATIVNIALPSAQRALHFSNDNRQWIVTAYALAFGSLLLLAGRLSALFGRKRTFLVGLVGFAVVSAIGGLAQSFGVLVAARALQGAFGALLAPAALSLLTVTFTDPAERAKAFGIFGALAGGGASVGLLLGGILTEVLSWRWCLYVNLVIAIPTALFAARLLPTFSADARPRLDLPGVLTASGGLFALVYGFANAETHSWSDAVTVVSLAASVALLAAFAVIERRVEHPLLPLRIVRDRQRAGAYVSIALSGAGIFAVFLFLTYFLQQNLGYSPIRSGLAFLPMTFAIVATATTAQTRLVARTGPKPLVMAGMVLAAAAMVVLAQLRIDSSYAGHVLPGVLLAGVGLGLIFAPSIAAATANVPAHDAGVASAMVNTCQQVGGSVGTALLSTLFANALSGYATSHPRGPGLMAHATVHGYTTAFWWAAGIFAVGLVLATLVFPGGRRGREAAAHRGEAEPALAGG